MKKHLALIIGPVIKTILSARHTRELWAASYLFSYLMKKIIGQLRGEIGLHFIVPFAQGEGSDPFFRNFVESLEAGDHPKFRRGAGLFPDQLMLQTDATDGFERVRNVVREVIRVFAKDAASDLYNGLSEVEKQQISISTFESNVKTWFFQFFRIYLVEQELAEGQNPIIQLSESLATCELQDVFPQTEENYLSALLDQAPGTFLFREALGGKTSFATLLEVAVRDFEGDIKVEELQRSREGFWFWSKKEKEEAEKTDEKTIINALLGKYGKAFRPAHKYVAVVHADGDGVGALIQGLKKDEDFARFSKTLKDFALDAVEAIGGYGGVPVYAGGDDLMFFAPVVRDSAPKVNGMPTHHIFDLLSRLNDLMKKHFEGKGFANIPTLSFGVSISFYKFPLFEALENSRRLLFGVAKNYGPRHAVAFSVRKHSGHEFEALLPMVSAVYDEFQKMLSKSVKNPGRVLSSINYHVRQNAEMYRHIGTDSERVHAFIDNCFDEAVHDETETSQYLGDVKALLAATFQQEGGDPDRAAQKIYALLRTADFLTSIENNDDDDDND